MVLKQNNLDKILNMSDKLDMLFYIQEKLQNKLGYSFLEFNNEYFNLMFIGLITELSEVIEHTKWKPWKKSSINNIKECQKELIDCWHFLINLSLACNLDANTLYYEFLNKNKINNERQKNGY